jgi:hypothetical protein
VIAGVVGPMLVSGTMNLWPPHTFAVTFIAQALVAVISAFILKGVKTSEPAGAVKRVDGLYVKLSVSQGFPEPYSAVR